MQISTDRYFNLHPIDIAHFFLNICSLWFGRMFLFLTFEIGIVNSCSTGWLSLELQSDSEFGIVILNLNWSIVLRDGL